MEAVFLPIQLSGLSLDCDVLNPEPNFLADLLLYIAMRFVVCARLINFCTHKRFCDFFASCTYSLNQALTFSRAPSGDTVFLEFIQGEHARS